MGLQLEHSSLESFIWVGITFATFSFSGNIPVANDREAIVQNCSVKKVFLKYRKIQRKTPVPESLL